MKTSLLQRKEALANLLDIDPEDVELEGELGFSADGGEYLVLDDDEADAAAAEYIRESVWAFNAEWIADYTPPGIEAEEINSLRGDRCESANQGLIAIIEAGRGMPAFYEDSIGADGRGHFLSPYDGSEEESLGFYIYRTN